MRITQERIVSPLSPQQLSSLKQFATLTLYYAMLIVITLAGLAYGYYFSELYFPSDKPERIEFIMNQLKLVWLVALPYALLNFYTFVRYPVFIRPKPQPLESRHIKSLKGKLFFRYVTRGFNPTLVADNVRQLQTLLNTTAGTSAWCIEVVTDNPINLPNCGPQIWEIVVPESYHPPQGSKFKARALHYALLASTAQSADWLIHLDEETQMDEETIWAIQRFVTNENNAIIAKQRAYPRIGQGVILYGARGLFNWLTTLADSLRVGDDYGRFRWQYEQGKAYFGMHGSFIVINNSVAKMLGFDHGPKASITEDAFLALLAQSKQIEFAFLQATMYEKSPFSLWDFAKQRRRWFGGLWLCALDKRLALSQRALLLFFMVLWSVSWLCIVMVYVNLFYPTETPVWLAMSGGVSFAYYVLLYLVGFFSTFSPTRLGLARFIGLLGLQLFFIPLFSLMEAIGVIYGILAPPKGFDIVQKELAAS